MKFQTLRNNFFSLLILLLFSLIIIYILVGPVNIPIGNSFKIIFHKLFIYFNQDIQIDKINYMVIWNIRIPRMLVAILVGAGLGTSGAILQSLFRNPLIDPGFIGVSSGAAVGAIMAIMFSNIFYIFFGIYLDFFLLPLLSMLGSFLTTYIIYFISKRYNKTNIMIMLLAGIAVNALSGSIIGFFISFISDIELRSFTFWTLGGLGRADWTVVYIMFVFIVLSLSIVYFQKYNYDIFMLGDEQASHLGLDVERLKKVTILLSSIIVGISVAFCGMIGFIGLVTPHLIRLFIGPKHKYLIPGSAFMGSILLLIADLLSKTVISPAQLPIGVVTSLIGAPFFIFLILKQKNKIGYVE